VLHNLSAEIFGIHLRANANSAGESETRASWGPIVLEAPTMEPGNQVAGWVEVGAEEVGGAAAE